MSLMLGRIDIKLAEMNAPEYLYTDKTIGELYSLLERYERELAICTRLGKSTDDIKRLIQIVSLIIEKRELLDITNRDDIRSNGITLA
jgi:hypothetical protein